MVVGEFNLLGVAIGSLFGVITVGVVFLYSEYRKFKAEAKKSIEWWER
jgi:hypothetical protein